jgi:opacity protein-like surface antigen
MKKIILSIIAVLAFGFTNAQEQTKKGKWLIEANTGFGAGVGSTSFGLWSEDGNTAFNIGAEAGYFVADNLAVKLGLGYGDDGSDFNSSSFAYKIGAKYYVVNKFPIEVSYNGVNIEDINENPSYVGLQGGYAWFLGPNVSVEPGLRYNISLNDDYYDSALQFNIGFALHF